MFSIVILTYNEARNIRSCLDSVAWCDDVHVIDSYSTDGTPRIAAGAGAKLVQRQFTDFADQRNFAIDNLDFRHDWVFHLDADEHFTAELLSECRRAITENRHSAFLVPSKMILWGRWLRHASSYPVYQMRLMKRGEVRFVQHGHGQREFSARRGFGRLSAPYLHHAFSKGFDDWFDRHNRYSAMEAKECLKQLGKGGIEWRALFSDDPVKRRRTLKELSLRLPFRPWLKFLYMYFWHRGLLDGYPGLTYCVLQAIYEYMICLKLKELRRGSAGDSEVRMGTGNE